MLSALYMCIYKFYEDIDWQVLFLAPGFVGQLRLVAYLDVFWTRLSVRHVSATTVSTPDLGLVLIFTIF